MVEFKDGPPGLAAQATGDGRCRSACARWCAPSPRTLMSAEADAMCGAPYGERSDDRVNRRNGYRDRDFDTRAGTVELRVPKLRQGSYYPDWLFERRRRAERALVAVICECYVRGVSTRRVDGLVKTLGLEGISKSQVSALAKTLDAEVAAFRSRPLRRRSLPLPVAGRSFGEGPRGRPGDERGHRGGNRGLRRWPSGDPGTRYLHERRRSGLDPVPAGSFGPGALWGAAGHLR